MGLIIVFILFLSCSNQNLIDTDKSYYDNNKIRYEVQKQNGKEHGIAKYWDINGNLINKVQYFYGQVHGEWIRYYISGQIKSIDNYKFDKKTGYSITYYQNGIKKSEVLYKDDIPISNIIRWDKDGKLIE